MRDEADSRAIRNLEEASEDFKVVFRRNLSRQTTQIELLNFLLNHGRKKKEENRKNKQTNNKFHLRMPIDSIFFFHHFKSFLE